MSGSALLYGGTAALGLGIVAVVAALTPKRGERRSVTQALASIDRRYARGIGGGQGGGARHLQLPDWLPGVAVRLSPASARSSLQHKLDVAGNPERWTPDRVLASKALCLVVLGAVGALLGLWHPGLVVLTGGAGAAAGFFLPDLLVYNAGLK